MKLTDARILDLAKQHHCLHPGVDEWWEFRDRADVIAFGRAVAEAAYSAGWNDCAATPAVHRAAEQEPIAFEFQHDETGRTTFVDPWQVEHGFAANNPRWQLIGPVYRHAAPLPRASDAAAHGDERASFAPQTYAGFTAVHVNETGCPPSGQEAFDAGVRAGIARAAQQVAVRAVVKQDLTTEGERDGGQS